MSLIQKYRSNKFVETIYSYSPRFVQNLIYSIFGYIKLIESKRITKIYKNEYNSIEAMSKKDIEVLQLKKLKALLNHSYSNSEYYRKAFDSLGYHPRQIKTLNDFKTLPIIDKKVFIKNNLILKSGNLNRFNPNETSTGGTTGTTLKFTMDRKTYLHKEYEALHYFSRHGYVQGKERSVIYRAGVIIPKGRKIYKPWRFDYSRKMVYLSSYYSSDELFNQYYLLLKEWKPRFMQFLPSAVFLFAKYLNDRDLKIKLQKCFSASEMLHEFQKREIEKAFQCPIFDHYGHSEPGIYVAGQCVKKNYHYYPNTVLPEVTKDGYLLETSLNNYSTPFIRYKVGDIVDGIHYDCKCGLKTPYFKQIKGRESNIIYSKDGRKMSDIGFDQIFRDNNVALGQILQEKKGELLLQIVPSPGFSESDKIKIISKLHLRVGKDTTVKLELVNDIHKSESNKFNLIISRINHNEN